MHWHFMPNQSYDCIQCGRSCLNHWNVAVDSARHSKICASHSPSLPADASNLFQASPHGFLVKKDGDGRCQFLTNDQRCSIHAALGAQAKPIVCQTYPYSMAVTPDGVFVGVTFSCTSALQNSGRPLAEHQPELEQYLEHYTTQRLGFDATPFWQNSSLSWEGYLALEKGLESHFMTGCSQDLWADLLRFCAHQYETATEMGPADIDSIFQTPLPNIAADLWPMLHQSSLMPLLMAAGADLDYAKTIFTPGEHQISLPRVGWTGSSDQLQRLLEGVPNQTFELEISRFLSAFLFQKFLLAGGCVLTSLALLTHLPQLLRLITALLADAQGQTPELRHFQSAVQILEEDLITHSHSGDQIFASIVQMIILMLQHSSLQ